MSQRLLVLRSISAALLVLLGLVIVARGLTAAAPFSFTAMGALMAILGWYRLRLIRRLRSGRP